MGLLSPSSGARRSPSRRAQTPGRKAVWRSAELQRIARLPRRDLGEISSPEVALALSESLRKPGSGFVLFPNQAALLMELADGGSGVYSMDGVGGGKSTVAALVGRMVGARRPCVVVPAKLKKSMEQVVIPRLARDFDFPRPVVISYTDLQLAKNDRLLFAVDPDCLVFDEGHKLRNKNSARYKRVRAFVEARRPRVVIMTGTPIRRSVRDLHLLGWTHPGGSCPVPRVYSELEDWALALDPHVRPEERLAPGALMELTRPGEDLREGFRRRLLDTPGVIGGGTQAVEAAITFSRLDVAVPPEVERALDSLRSTWEMPDGDPVTEALDYWRACRELAQGFYYVWDWPGGVPDFAWLDARKGWRQAVASVTRLSREGLYSEKQVRTAAERAVAGLPVEHELPKASRGDVLKAWARWGAERGKPEPPRRAVWLSDFLVRASIAWAEAALASDDDERAPGGIVWVESAAFADRAAELTAGTPGIRHCGPGPKAEALLLSLASSSEPASVFASKWSYGEGQNLQRWCRNLLPIPLPSGSEMEQLVGRTHRPGQLSDEVSFEYFAHAPELREALVKMIEDARFQQVKGGRQKVLMATWAEGMPEREK